MKLLNNDLACDKVFAILGLCEDRPPPLVIYSSTLSELVSTLRNGSGSGRVLSTVS